MTHEQIIKALNSLAPQAQWTLTGDDYSELNWLSDGIPPSLDEIEAEIKLLPSKELAAKENKENAKSALLEKLGITAEEARLLLS